MLAVYELSMFSPPPVFSPTADQKKHWICLASRNYEESYNDDCIAAILLDGLFVHIERQLTLPVRDNYDCRRIAS